MAKLRKFVAYRGLERPYTRFSKFQAKNYVRAKPVCKVVRFDMGDKNRTYEYEVQLLSKSPLQIRDNALESARQTSNRRLETALGKTGYFFQARVYPHHVLRENPLASGAGADRMSTGMARAFGKPIGIAARVRKGQILFSVRVDKPHIELARSAMKDASHKLPCSCVISVEKIPAAL